MSDKIILLPGLLICSTPVLAHVGIESDAGVLANIIAVAIVVLSIVVYLLMSSRKRKKTSKNKK